jgi:hypothetical protein
MAGLPLITPQEVIETVAAMPQEDWMKIQCGIADLITARLSSEEIVEIRVALAEAEAEFERGEGMSSETIKETCL